MVYLNTLWLPIVLSAVVVFVASAVMHMALKYHKSDYKKLPGEERILEAIRKEGVTRGTYFFPHCVSMQELKSPEVMERFKRGPVGLLTALPSGPPTMTKALVQWFVYCLCIGVLVAYVTGRTVSAGSDYLAVFRVAGTVAFLGYAGAHATNSIWKGELWSTTLKHLFDGLVYGLLTAGVFGWLWPR